MNYRPLNVTLLQAGSIKLLLTPLLKLADGVDPLATEDIKARIKKIKELKKITLNTLLSHLEFLTPTYTYNLFKKILLDPKNLKKPDKTKDKLKEIYFHLIFFRTIGKWPSVTKKEYATFHATFLLSQGFIMAETLRQKHIPGSAFRG